MPAILYDRSCKVAPRFAPRGRMRAAGLWARRHHSTNPFAARLRQGKRSAWFATATSRTRSARSVLHMCRQRPLFPSPTVKSVERFDAIQRVERLIRGSALIRHSVCRPLFGTLLISGHKPEMHYFSLVLQSIS